LENYEFKVIFIYITINLILSEINKNSTAYSLNVVTAEWKSKSMKSYQADAFKRATLRSVRFTMGAEG